MSAVGISWLVVLQSEKSARAVCRRRRFNSAKPPPLPHLSACRIELDRCRLLRTDGLFAASGFHFRPDLHGWHRAAVYLVFAALQAAVAIGLWRLREWGRRLALGVFAFGGVQAAVCLVRPSLLLRYIAELNQIMGTPCNRRFPRSFRPCLRSL